MTASGNRKNVAVTGMGGCCAAGNSIPEIRQGIQSGRVNCHPVPEKLYRGEFVSPVFTVELEGLADQTRHFLECSGSGFPADRLNRTMLLVIASLAEALADAGLNHEVLRSQRVGIALGTTVGCTFNDQEYFLAWRQGKMPDPEPVFRYLDANLSRALQKILGVRGPAAVITNACASGTDAVGIARNWLLRGDCDIAIAGGADGLSRISYYGFAALMLMSDLPCRPFDRDRSGLNLGEGAAVIIMETSRHAAARRVPGIGWIEGYGAASDGYHPIAPHPEGSGLRKALRTALHDAAIGPEGISFVNGHGTATVANDAAEMSALAAIGLTDCPVVSTKGMTGHMLGAAGAMEAILTLLTLADGQTGGSVNCTFSDPSLSLQAPVESEQISLRGRTGISQSLAFGGSNSALVLEAAAS